MKAPIFPARRHRESARSRKIRKLIDRLREGPMNVKDIAPFLHMTDGGVRKYTAELQLAWIIRQCGEYKPGNGQCKTFELTKHEELLKGYLAAIEPGPKKARPVPPLEPGRHIHTLRDDDNDTKVRKVKPVLPDPFALDPAFFKRSAPAEGDQA